MSKIRQIICPKTTIKKTASAPVWKFRLGDLNYVFCFLYVRVCEKKKRRAFFKIVAEGPHGLDRDPRSTARRGEQVAKLSRQPAASAKCPECLIARQEKRH